MDTMLQFKRLVDSLKDSNLSVVTKLQNYTKLLNTLPSKLTKEDVLKNQTTLHLLFGCVKLDLASESLNLRQSVLLILEQICKCTWRIFVLQDLTDLCIRITFDEVVKCKDDVRIVVLKCLQCLMQELILQNDCDPEKLLLKLEKEGDRKEILELLGKACQEIPNQDLSLVFYYDTVVPGMFNTSIADVRGCLVEFTLATLPKYEIRLFNTEKFDQFKITTKKTYVDKIIKLLESHDPSWNKVWIFLLRCYGKMLLTHSDILNALLRVVETAFRSKIVSISGEAYDCWKELIDVYSFDSDQMCSPKYIKLLLLPLKNNSVRHKDITKKRFDLWVHLISVLQDKSYELCIRQFLDFCFGSLCEIPLITRGNPYTSSPARSNSEIWILSAQALLEIMGHHGHDDSNNCLDCTTNPLLKLQKPLINTKNFIKMDYIIINSIGECCSLMLNQIDNETTKNLYIKAIRCLWASLFSIIEQLPKPDQDSAIQKVTALLAVYVELSDEAAANFEYILKPVFEMLSKNSFYNIDVPRFNTQLLFPLLQRFLKNNDAVFLSGKGSIIELLRSSKSIQNKNSWLEEAFEIFVNTDIKISNIKGLLTLWINCADVLNEICEFPTGQTEKVIQTIGVGFMLWPILNMHLVPTEEKLIVTDVCVKWGNTFINLLKTYTKQSLNVLIKLQENMESSSPVIAVYVAQLYPGFKPLLDTEPNHTFVMRLVQLTATLLGLPVITRNVKSLILPSVLLIMNYFTVDSDKTNKYSDFQHMCRCFEHILHVHKEYSILKQLINFFEKMPKIFREYVPPSLHTIVNGLKTHSNVQIGQDAQKLSLKFIKNETFLQPKFIQTSRAAKITNMAMTLPKSPKIVNSGGTTVLRLLGHKVDSPITTIRGSQIDNKPLKRKAANVFPDLKKNKVNIDDEEASYVLIDQQYQFDPTKLSEHQIEVMKKRRTDIPALYQDLSQSQSNSQSFMNVNKANDQSEGKLGDNTCEKAIVVEAVPLEGKKEEKSVSEDLFHTEDVRPNSNDENVEIDNSKPQELKSIQLILSRVDKPVERQTKSGKGRGRPFSKLKQLKKVSDEKEVNIVNPVKETNNVGEVPTTVLQIQNPSMKKIEAMITEDTNLSPNYNQGFLSVLVNQNTGDTTVAENDPETKQPPINVSAEKRMQKIQKELNKIKMDIVGGDKFVQNINLTERRQTRRSIDPASLILRSKLTYDSDDSKSSNSSDSSRKSKLRATVKIVDKISKDKLSSPKSNNKIRSPSRNNTKSNTDEVKHSTAQRKLILEEPIKEKTNEGIKTRRSSVTIEEPESEPRNFSYNTRKSKSVSPEKPPESPESKRKPKSDKNWIAKVNKSLEECAKNSKVVGARKSLTHALEAACNAEKAKDLEKKSDFTVTLLDTNPQSQNSEDVIESSQESCIQIHPCQNIDKSIDNIKKGIDLQIEAVVSQLRKGEIQNSNAPDYVIENQTLLPKIDTDTDTVSKDVDNKVFSSFSLDELMRTDLASHVKNQNDTSEMNTETLELLSETPTKPLKIPTSPIASDTPTRTNELITNTLNISPIKVVPPKINPETTTPNLFDSEPCTSSKLSPPNSEKIIDTKPPSPPENIKSDIIPYQQPGCSTISDKTNQRSLKLLRMVGNAATPENKILKVKVTPKPYISSPKTHRIVQMMKPFEKKSESEDVAEVIQIENLEEETKNLILEKDILKFVKELPSPMASPGNSILKRRAPDSREEGLSPPRKKRVNFSDPPTTCEKVFFKDKNEHAHSKKDEHKETISDENGTNIPAVESITTSNTNTDPPLVEPMNIVKVRIVETVMRKQISLNNDSEKEQLEETASNIETESLAMATQGSVDITDPYLLEYNQPILPEFINCKDSIDCVLGKLANPLFCFTLANELEKKRVFTIGDLAKLSEIDITRLPFRTPKVLVVRTALRKYMSQKSPETKPPTTDLQDNKKIEQNHVSNDQEQEITSEAQQQIDHSSSLTLDRPKVTLVSSIILQPARSVSQNSPKADRSPRRVPLINVTSLNTPSCSTFKQAVPIVEIEPSSSQESDSSKTVLFGNVEERENLRIRIPELIADFQEMREKVKRQGLSTTSLYELIIEIVGTEEFVSILQGNKALSINRFVKNNDWCTLIDEIICNIGLNKTISCLCNAKNVTPSKIVDSTIDHIITKQEGMSCSSSLEKIAYNVVKNLPLSNILQKFGMRRSIDALCEMNKSSEFTVEDFFQHATFRFSPSLDDMVPSFRNINVVHLNDKTVQLSSGNRKDFDTFLLNIGAVMEKSSVFENCKNQAKNIAIKCIPDVIDEDVMVLDELPSSIQNDAVNSLDNKISTLDPEELALYIHDKMSPGKRKDVTFKLFDKLSKAEAYECWTKFFGKHYWKT